MTDQEILNKWQLLISAREGGEQETVEALSKELQAAGVLMHPVFNPRPVQTAYTCLGRAIYQEGEYVGREGCGQDLTAQILGVPEDGRNYKLPCPCGKLLISLMRTPPAKE
jgi:hypothetical protein